jgi:hypothetical protein
MKDGPDTGHRPAQACVITQVRHGALDRLLIDPAKVARPAHEGADAIAALEQPVNQVASNESGGPGDKDKRS